MPNEHRHRALCAMALAVLVSGCASLPPDRGWSEVAQHTAQRGLTLPTGDARKLSTELLAQALTIEAATTLALLNNPRLRQLAAQLGLNAADVYDAARLSNPVIGLTRLTSNDPSLTHAEVSGSIALSFTELLLLPARSRYAEAQFAAAKLEVAHAVLELAAEVETTWYALAAAGQQLALRQQIAQAAEASAALAQRYFEAGNLKRGALALERASAAQAQLEAQAAVAELQGRRSQMNRLLGLPAQAASWHLAAGLSVPLTEEDELEALHKLAMDSRLDIAAARQQAQAIADAYQLQRRTRLLGPVEAGYEITRESDNSRSRGPSLAFELPLFNWGRGRVERAQAELDAAEAHLAALELDRSNAISAAHTELLQAKTRAVLYRDTLIPQREAVVEQMQREHNYMLIGVFELLAAKQQEYAAYAGYLDAVRDYWLARVQLSLAVGNRLPSSQQTATPIPKNLDGTESRETPAPPAHHHHGNH